MPEITRLRRVGHKGADLIVPGNTLASFDAAVAAGVDMIEFDVLPERGTDRLLLAHDYADAAKRTPHTLEEALAYLGSARFDGIEFDLDLKLPGYEQAVLGHVRDAQLSDRVLISTQYRSSLELIRASEPGVRLGWSVPKIKRDPFRSRTTAVAALAMVRALRLVLPGRAAAAINAGLCDALMVHWRLVTARLVSRVRAVDGEIYVWTVDELSQLAELEALGVTGVITNDPRLFGELAAR
jgi:glycerophosphoryl diester phosphodiesterase